MTYEHYDKEVYDTIDSPRNNLHKVAVGTFPRSCSIPKMMYRLTLFMISFVRLQIL